MSTVLETFENTPYTASGSSFTWSENGAIYSWARSSSHVTQGSFSWRWNDTTGGDTQILSGSPTGAAIDFSAYTAVTLDVYVATIDAGESVTLSMIDGSFNTASAATVAGATGASTLTITFADNPSVDFSDIILFAISPAIAGTPIDYYLDNFVGVSAGGGGTSVAVFMNHLKTQGIA